jgi:Ni/Fe-hydrogenase subunit HybB-like protein
MMPHNTMDGKGIMSNKHNHPPSPMKIFTGLAAAGALIFIAVATIGDPARAWQAYLLNFLFFSAIAQGAVVFSALMHTVKARWSGPLADVAESFAAFFPVSLVLFVILFLGRQYVFPWLHEDLHGKEVWLNLPFLFGRDFFALCLLYGVGLAFLYHRLYFTLNARGATGPLGRRLLDRWDHQPLDERRIADRTTVFAILYLLAFAVVLSLVGYDLVMAADPHWYSTLFGAYCFVKAVYIGFGGLIVLGAILHMSEKNHYHLEDSQFHDIGKLFFAFCLVWADFFYAQFVVIWYGNLPEETAYIIKRTMLAPWNALAWTVFIGCFVAPFLILLNRRIKTRPKAMTVICLATMTGIWLEHYLLLGPAFHQHADHLPLGWVEVAVAIGFFGLLAASVTTYLKTLPELLEAGKADRLTVEAG